MCITDYSFFSFDIFHAPSLHLLFPIAIEPMGAGKSSQNVSYHICKYYKTYYQKVNFSSSLEAHMKYITIIRNLREDSDKTQKEIADYLGTSQTMYARYERGANEMPIHHLIRLAEYYNVSLDYLCGMTTFKYPYPPL